MLEQKKNSIAEDLLETYFRENKGMRPTANLMMKNTVFSVFTNTTREALSHPLQAT